MWKIKTIYHCVNCGVEYDASEDSDKLHEQFFHHANGHCMIDKTKKEKK